MRNNFSTKVNFTLWYIFMCDHNFNNHNFYGIMVMMTKYYQKKKGWLCEIMDCIICLS